MALQIVIAQRGWVFVGDVTADGDNVRIDNAKCVRRWGTKTGLGEIALNGPTPNTVLDDCGTVRMHVLAIVASIDCKAEKWPAR
jgi:hypothetical protein